MKCFIRVYAILLKELIQLKRDRLTFGMVIMIPLIQLILFGYAINTTIRQIPVGLVDNHHSGLSRLLTQTISATGVVNFIAHYRTVEEAEAAVATGQVRAVLVLPPDLAQRVAQHPGVNVLLVQQTLTDSDRPVGQWLVDSSDTMIAMGIKSLVNMPLKALLEQPNVPTSPTFEITLLYNPEQRSVVNIVPGLVAIILTMTMVMFTALAIVRERERGNLELLITTPIRPLELMIGKVIPYLFIGLLQVTIILGLGRVVFNVPLLGSLWDLLFAILIFISASLTLGLVLSTVAQTQLQAVQLTIFVLLPSILLSGFMFPLEGMPHVAQHIAELLPVTHFIRLIRAIVLKDVSLLHMDYDFWWLTGFTLIGLVLASMRFKKSL